MYISTTMEYLPAYRFGGIARKYKLKYPFRHTLNGDLATNSHVKLNSSMDFDLIRKSGSANNFEQSRITSSILVLFSEKNNKIMI